MKQYSMTIWYEPSHLTWYDEGVYENLVAVKEAGFTHINWNPDAGSSYLYAEAEMDHFKDMLDEVELGVKTIHAAHGHHYVMEITSPHIDRRKDITSDRPWRQQAGIELVNNRILLASKFECDNIVLHIPIYQGISNCPDRGEFLSNLYVALDKIRPYAEEHNVTIAIENLTDAATDSIFLFESLFEQYPADFIGWCYDSGHANVNRLDVTLLDGFRERLKATHISDNFGAVDQHLLPGDGSMDWDKITKFIAESSYELPLNYETPPERYSIRKRGYYERAYATIVKLTDMVITHRGR